MTNENIATIFVTATRQKFRFDTARGKVNTEQVWDMPLTSKDGFDLDTLANNLADELDAVQGKRSFVRADSAKTERVRTIESKLEIVKHIIQYKLELADAIKSSQAKSQEKAKLLELLAKKQDSALAELSEDELKKRIAEL